MNKIINIEYRRLIENNPFNHINSLKMRLILLISCLTLITQSILATETMENQNNEGKTEKVTFGAGCFWCVEAIFERVKGVTDVQSGYSGGHVENPSYKEVCNGTTGHAEVCQLTYKPDVISYIELLEIFWQTHDPTTLNRQGNDAGTQYRSVIFFHNSEQQRLAEEMKKRLNNENIWNKPIVTEVVAFDKFYPAGDDHNDYYEKNPTQSYCSVVITPKVQKFEKIFREYIKEQKIH
ncbi:Peptide methionine sulfoxide reductase MsrA [subsurface metagenome]